MSQGFILTTTYREDHALVRQKDLSPSGTIVCVWLSGKFAPLMEWHKVALVDISSFYSGDD